MVHLSLELANKNKWEGVASAQAQTEDEAKSLMLDNVLFMLDDNTLLPLKEGIRLVYRNNDLEVVKREVFLCTT